MQTTSSDGRANAYLGKCARGVLLAVTVAGVALAAGCQTAPLETEDSSDGVRVVHQELSVYGDVVSAGRLWSKNPDVCFRNNGGYCVDGKCQDQSTNCMSDSQCDGLDFVDGDGNFVRTGMPIRDCVETDPAQQASEPCYEARKARFAAVLENTWEAASGLTFNIQGDCPVDPATNPPNTTMVINLLNIGGGGACGAGLGARCEFAGSGEFEADGITPNPFWNAEAIALDFDWVTVHEVGHGLGMPHEHQRVGSNICTSSTELSAACTACTDGGCDGDTGLANCTCLEVDYLTCTQSTVTLAGNDWNDGWAIINGGTDAETDAACRACVYSGTCAGWQFRKCFGAAKRPTSYTLTVDEYNDANGIIYNNGPDPNVVGLTLADPDSVMNYCGPRPELVTGLDQLGMEILYPKVQPFEAGCAEACWDVDDRLLLHSGGRIQDGWMTRGAWPWWTSTPQWTQSGTPLASGATLPASAILGPVGDVSFAASNKYNGEFIAGAPTTAEVDDAEWTAIGMTVLTPL